jgi:recombinational DNA repair protein (RecF pathway)
VSAITVEQSAAWWERRGLALGEQADDTTHCTECGYVTDPDDLTDLDGQQVCRPCVTDLTGDDPFSPDHARDL